MPCISWKGLYFLCVLFLVCADVHAQTLNGIVTNKQGQPLSLASVALLQDSSLVAATATDGKGSFSFKIESSLKVFYQLHVSLIGYRPIDLSFQDTDTMPLRLVLMEDSKLLGEVSLTARRPMVTHLSDRYIVNVENSILANGRSALEVLQGAPGIWVDNKGSIRLKGTQAVMVMINDVVQRMTEEELADYLRSLKSEDIARIEVISMPPAEFEAAGAGGIIHIILKKGRKNGWNGSLNTQYWQQGRQPYFTIGGLLNYQYQKIYLSGSYSYVSDQRSIVEKAEILYSDQSSFSNLTDRDEKIRRHQYRFGMICDLDATQSLSLQTAMSATDFHHVFTGNESYGGNQPSAGQAGSEKNRRFHLSSTTLNYAIKLDTTGSTLKFIADYTDNDRAETNSFFKLKSVPSVQEFWRNEAPLATRVYSVQSDLTKLISANAVIRAGAKYVAIRRDNRLTTEDLAGTVWLIDSGKTNRFIYNENLWMVYASLERTIKSTNIKAGLRAEETYSTGDAPLISRRFSRNYFGLFPSLFILQNLDAKKEKSITFGYARRLTRPSLSDLNAARMEFSNYTALIGNPYLLPQYSHNFSLAYQFLKDHSLEASFTRVLNSIALSAQPGIGNSIDYYSENTGSSTQYGLSYSGVIMPLKRWTIINNLAAYRSAYRFHQDDYHQTTVYAKTVHTLTMNVADIDLVADYRSPYVYTNLYTYGNFNLDLGATRKIFHAKGRLRLAITDLFNSSREKELTEEKGTSISFYRKRPTRTFRLSFTYNFSAGRKLPSKKIEQGAAEERGRIGN